MICGADGFWLVEWGSVGVPGGVWVASRPGNRLLIGQETVPSVNALFVLDEYDSMICCI